ncbi:uncharacterized protein [Vicugna pacos]|uniref:Uncharacterized protein n=1 Tax=Vicugna pacos TaxID=30538 RepID=A0ABM5BIG4_VICPA
MRLCFPQPPGSFAVTALQKLTSLQARFQGKSFRKTRKQRLPHVRRSPRERAHGWYGRSPDRSGWPPECAPAPKAPKARRVHLQASVPGAVRSQGPQRAAGGSRTRPRKWLRTPAAKCPGPLRRQPSLRARPAAHPPRAQAAASALQPLLRWPPPHAGPFTERRLPKGGTGDASSLLTVRQESAGFRPLQTWERVTEPETEEAVSHLEASHATSKAKVSSARSPPPQAMQLCSPMRLLLGHPISLECTATVTVSEGRHAHFHLRPFLCADFQTQRMTVALSPAGSLRHSGVRHQWRAQKQFFER